MASLAAAFLDLAIQAGKVYHEVTPAVLPSSLAYSYLDRLGLFDLPTSVGLRYENLFFSLPKLFLSAEVVRIAPSKKRYFA